MGPHESSDLVILISGFELISFGISIITQVNRIVCQTIGVGSSPDTQILLLYFYSFSLCFLYKLLFSHFPSSVFSFQILNPFLFELGLPSCFLLLSFLSIISGIIFLKPLQCYIITQNTISIMSARPLSLQQSTHSRSL